MIGLVVLAAGASRRMGQAKALLLLEGEPLLLRVLASAQAAGVQSQDVVVAIGPPHGALIRDQLGAGTVAAGVRWAWNEQPEQGMLSSVQCALPALPPTVKGALVWPVDIPQVRVATLEAIIQAAAAQEWNRMVVPVCGPRGGHPLWLPRRLFAEALALSPTLGLRALRERHPPLRLAVEDEAILRDLDTPQDVRVASTEPSRP